MIFDMDQPQLVGETVAYPDWGFALVPDSVIIEDSVIRGRSDTSQNVTGIVDDVE